MNKSLLEDAYKYIYSKNTYPVLVDNFHDNNDNEVFAYNRNIKNDKEFIQTLFKADNFIFDVLDGSLSDNELRSRFDPAISSYRSSQSDVSLSRIYDEKYYITTTPEAYFQVNAQLKFSIVSKNNTSNNPNKKYREMEGISSAFNVNSNWLIARYPYLNRLNTFASYQALFRSLPQNKVDISDLIFSN